LAIAEETLWLYRTHEEDKKKKALISQIIL